MNEYRRLNPVAFAISTAAAAIVAGAVFLTPFVVNNAVVESMRWLAD